METKNDEQFDLDKDVFRSFPTDLAVAPSTFEEGFDQDETFRSVPMQLPAMDSYGADDVVFRGMAMPLAPPKLSAGAPAGFDDFGAFNKDTAFDGASFPGSFQSFQKDVTFGSAPIELEPVTPLPLPPAPFYLERASHFHSNSAVDALVSAIEQTLTNHHVDFRLKPKKCKWRCKAYSNCHGIDMRVQVFTLTSGNLAIEFQRREGNLVEFRKLYSAVYAELVSEGHVCCEKGEAVTEAPLERARMLPRLPVPALGGDRMEGALSEDDGENALLPLVEMMQTEFVDIQLEAVRAVANLAMADTNWELFRSTKPAVPTLVKLCSSGDANVRRCAVTALSELTRCPKLCASTVAAGGVKAMLSASTPPTSLLVSDGGVVSSQPPALQLSFPDLTTLEVMRNSVAALANLSGSLYKKQVQETCAPTLLKLTSSPDPVLRGHANRAAAHLANSGCAPPPPLVS